MSQSHQITGTSPAAQGTAVVGSVTGQLGQYDGLSIIATLEGATGGTLDVYLQYSPDQGTTWIDYAHFPQLAAGAASSIRVWNVSRVAQQLTLTTVGSGSSPALAANTILGGEFGDRMRCVCVAGASTSVGASVVIKILGTPGGR